MVAYLYGLAMEGFGGLFPMVAYGGGGEEGVAEGGDGIFVGFVYLLTEFLLHQGDGIGFWRLLLCIGRG